MLYTTNPTVIIIDCQLAIDSFDTSERSNPGAEREIGRLLQSWRHKKWPIVHVRHSSKSELSPYHESKPTFMFKHEVEPLSGETIVTKSENCAFVDTDLDDILKLSNSSELVICGVLTHHSIDATVRYAAALGYRIIVPSTCTASFAITVSNGKVVSSDMVQDIFLSNLHGEYCEVVESVIV